MIQCQRILTNKGAKIRGIKNRLSIREICAQKSLRILSVHLISRTATWLNPFSRSTYFNTRLVIIDRSNVTGFSLIIRVSSARVFCQHNFRIQFTCYALIPLFIYNLEHDIFSNLMKNAFYGKIAFYVDIPF